MSVYIELPTNRSHCHHVSHFAILPRERVEPIVYSRRVHVYTRFTQKGKTILSSFVYARITLFSSHSECLLRLTKTTPPKPHKHTFVYVWLDLSPALLFSFFCCCCCRYSFVPRVNSRIFENIRHFCPRIHIISIGTHTSHPI